MGYVYKYTDVDDGIVKYVGIVWSENRTLLQRLKEHQLYDWWCNGKQWKVEYLYVNNKTDCEGLESHFIALYNTDKWYNKNKTNWGISNVYSMIEWEWKEFNYIFDNVNIKNRNNRRINNNFLSKLYNDSIYIFNNGICYCFFRTFKKEPIYVYMALSSDEEEFAIKNNIRYMNSGQLNSINRLIKEDEKPYGYGTMLNEIGQIKIEGDLYKEQCYTYKEYENEMNKILRCHIKEIKEGDIDIDNLRLFVKRCIYELNIDVEKLREQKLRINT